MRNAEAAGCGPKAGAVRNYPAGGPLFLVTQRVQVTTGVDASLAQPFSEGLCMDSVLPGDALLCESLGIINNEWKELVRLLGRKFAAVRNGWCIPVFPGDGGTD
ncbi:MAG: hypothetical protein ACTHYS_01515 [Ancrocorticia populi]|uniref:hypothetical protein n=1 Tax=Ancrocorticia populi TaxID=2175228 RepID=UPI003F8E92AA